MRDGNLFNWIWFEAMDFSEYYSGFVFWISLLFMTLLSVFVYMVCGLGWFFAKDDPNVFLRIIHLFCAIYYSLATKWWWLWLAIPFGVSIIVWAHVYCYAYAHCRSWGGK